MSCHFFLFAVLVGVAWGQRALRPAPPVLSPQTRQPTESPTTMATTTARPQQVQPAWCVPRMAVFQAEEELNKPEDQEYNISEEESQKLLTALEAEGIGRNEGLLQARNAEFATPNVTLRTLNRRPCSSFNNSCPHYWRRLVTVRHFGPCGVEYCRPLPWYSSYYAVCSCRSCYWGWGRCMPINYKTRVLLAFCYHPRFRRWNIRAVWVTLPQSCECRTMCRG